MGPHIVSRLMQNGHEVTTFTRGILPPVENVESIVGDRDKGFYELRERRWDVVIDTCGFFPSQVKSSVRFFHLRTNTYVFISSVNAYRDAAQPSIDELYPLAKTPLLARFRSLNENNYGALKAGCEAVVKSFFPKRNLILRPGYIAGAADPSRRLATLVQRIKGETHLIIPGYPDNPWQIIDVDDLAQWLVLALEKGLEGAYNLTGPSLSAKTILETLANLLDVGTRFRWMGDGASPAGVRDPVMEWANLPSSWVHLYRINSNKAVKDGLIIRPLAETASRCVLDA